MTEPSVEDKRRALLARRLRQRADRRPGSAGTAGREDCLILLRAGAGAPLFLLPAVGGSAGPYVALVDRLRPGRPVYGLESPGLHGEQTARRLDEQAAMYLELITEVWPRGPYLLCGWSVGGMIAQEIAVRLREHDQDVALLLLLDAVLPSPADEPADETVVLEWFAQDMAATLRETPPDLTELRQAPEGDRTDVLVAALERAGIVPEGIRAEMRQRIATFTANSRAYATWRPRPVDVPITFVLAEATHPSEADRWRSHTSSLRCGTVPGTHHSMLHPPALDRLVDVVSRCVGEAP
jgi:thioesterase domain-containing protein